MPIGSGAFLAGTLGSAALGFLGGERRNNAQMDLAQMQMDFQREMSNTAVQRRMKDMRAAGINPILAARYDATTPPGAMANLENPMIAATGAANAATTAFGTLGNLEVMEEQKEKIRQETQTLKNLLSSTEVVEDVGDFLQGATGKLDTMANMITDHIGRTIKMGWDLQQSVKQQVRTMLNEVQQTTSNVKEAVNAIGQKTQDIYINITNESGSVDGLQSLDVSP